MPTNANTFNSRVTSEALEAKYRQVFPSQGGAELPQDLFASGVIQPVVDFSTVAEGSVLPSNLQTAWDFSTSNATVATQTYTDVITNTGFWQVDFTCGFRLDTSGTTSNIAAVVIYDGSTRKAVWAAERVTNTSSTTNDVLLGDKMVVFLRAGDSLQARTQGTNQTMEIWYRQIADINGNLVNPLGFTFS